MRHLAFFLLLAALLGSGCATTSSMPPLRTVPHVDLDRYSGRWWVIAHVPYFLERGKVATADTYRVRPDGKLDNIFSFRRGSFDAPEESWNGVAWVTNPATNAEWKVQFIWPLRSTYLVLELDPDYRWAVVGTPGRSLVWVLARDQQLAPDVYAEIERRLVAQGYDLAKLARVPQPGP